MALDDRIVYPAGVEDAKLDWTEEAEDWLDEEIVPLTTVDPYFT